MRIKYYARSWAALELYSARFRKHFDEVVVVGTKEFSVNGIRERMRKPLWNATQTKIGVLVRWRKNSVSPTLISKHLLS